MSHWFATLRSSRLERRLKSLHLEYQERLEDQEAAAWQLSRLNHEWQAIRGRVPFWRERRNLPATFESWQDFSQRLDPMDRPLIQGERHRLYREDLAVRSYRSTGGSTGEPLRLPVGGEELEVARLNLWYGRQIFGIRPSDRLFLLWGHAHALGSGMRGAWAARWRKAADSALGYLRWSAYDLSATALRKAGEALLRFRPSYLIGYSVALDRLARANHDRADRFARLKLKGVIATAEGFPHPVSPRLISSAFGCPVIMEYGTVETGPIAYGLDGAEYRPFWRDFYLESSPVTGLGDRFELLVTALYPRVLPLLRYRIGDLVDTRLGAPRFRRRIPKIIGRCNDFVRLGDGTIIHSEAFTHAVKTTTALQSFQVCQEAGGGLHIDYQADRDLSLAEQTEITSRLARIDPRLGEIRLRRRHRLEQTAAGKTKAIVKVAAGASVE